jgi:DNA-binding CsgD family transcriptional regulator
MQAGAAVERFLAAALAPEEWPRALDAISEALGASGATMVLGRTRRAHVAVSNSVIGLTEEYFHLPIPDTRETRVVTRISDGFRTDYDDFTPAEMARDPYYQEFLAPHGLGYHAAATLASGNDELVLSLKRPARFGHYDGHELDQLQRALPHLRRAARTAALAWRASFAGQLDAFAHIGIGAVLLDRRGRAVEVNEAVSLGDAIDIVNGELTALLGSDRLALGAAIRGALGYDLGAASPPPSTVVLHRPAARRPVIADVLPIAGAMQSLLAPAVAIVLLRDLDRRPEPPVALLRRTFGLTPREAELAAQLARGVTLREAAETLAISELHARQRLKVIFAKTGATRQTELVMLLVKLT